MKRSIDYDFQPFYLQARFDGAGLKFHVKCATEFKTCYRLWFGPLRSAVVVCHPDTVKVIQSSNAPKERFVYNLVRPFIGECLLIRELKRSPLAALEVRIDSLSRLAIILRYQPSEGFYIINSPVVETNQIVRLLLYGQGVVHMMSCFSVFRGWISDI